MESKRPYSLLELQEYLRRVLALNFGDPLWVSCELAQVSRSRGHFFLSLVQQKEETEAYVARTEGVLWAMDYRRLRRKHGVQIDQLFQEGMSVLLQVRVDYHERFGLKLIIADVDPAYSVGKMALRRQQIVADLEKQGLRNRNAQIPLKPVLQKIAVLSSSRAAGYQDFIEQLTGNGYGYQFHAELFPVAMQGEMVKKEVPAQLKNISQHAAQFDAVVLIRGGGARLDLLAFDQREVGVAIAECPLPVFTGIGHDSDESVADLVAHTALKTPTAVADFLIEHNLQFEQSILELGQMIRSFTQSQLQGEQLELAGLKQQLTFFSRQHLQTNRQSLHYFEEQIQKAAKQYLKQESWQLTNLEQLIQSLDPEQMLRRGFVQVQRAGEVITHQEQLAAADEVALRFQDGIVHTKVLEENG